MFFFKLQTQVQLVFFNLMNFKKAAQLAPTLKSPAADKSLKSPGRPNNNSLLEMDLSQDDVNDILGGLNDKNDATKTMAAMQKHGNESNKKKSSKADAPNSAIPVVAKSSPLPSKPPTSKQPSPSPSPSPLTTSSPPQIQQQQNEKGEEHQRTTRFSGNKRQRTRSTGVRHKVSDMNILNKRLTAILHIDFHFSGVYNLRTYDAQFR